MGKINYLKIVKAKIAGGLGGWEFPFSLSPFCYSTLSWGQAPVLEQCLLQAAREIETAKKKIKLESLEMKNTETDIYFFNSLDALPQETFSPPCSPDSSGPWEVPAHFASTQHQYPWMVEIAFAFTAGEGIGQRYAQRCWEKQTLTAPGGQESSQRMRWNTWSPFAESQLRSWTDKRT